ncbi:MAG: hypothetical protein QOE45_1092 [Frankiaceae bacterium]|nr:hypothetical protein [Frankiaceae bacterium]
MAGLNVRFADGPGGRAQRPVERRMLALATGFLAAPTYLAVRESTNTASFTAASSLSPAIVANRLPNVGAARLAEWPAVALRIATAVRRSDWVYARLPSPWGFAACRAARLLRRPYWVSLHGDAAGVFDLRAERAATPPARAYHRLRARATARRTHAVARGSALTMSVGEDLDARYGRSAPRRLVFANFLHSTVAASREVRAGRPVVLFVGGLNHHKGLPDLLAAAGSLAAAGRDFELRLVGDGVLRQQALDTRLPGAADIAVAGWLDAAALDAEYARAALLVLPSTGGEGVPKVVMEAQARRVPVVAADVGGIRGLVGDGRGWLVEPGDVAGLAAAIATVLDGCADVTARVNAAAEHLGRNTFDRTQDRLADAVRSLEPGLVKDDAG